jgi:hypothetical protein
MITVDYDAELYDVGASFSGDTFTVPTAGTYLLTAGVGTNDTAAPNVCEARFNASTTGIIAPSNREPLGNETFPLSASIKLVAGETVIVQFRCDGGSQTIDILASNESLMGAGTVTFFSGILLH